MWRIIQNQVLYREQEPVTDTTWYYNDTRNQSTRNIYKDTLELKTTIEWIKEIREDVEELKITVVDLYVKTQNLQELK